MSLVARVQALFNVPSFRAGDLVRLRFGPDVDVFEPTTPHDDVYHTFYQVREVPAVDGGLTDYEYMLEFVVPTGAVGLVLGQVEPAVSRTYRASHCRKAQYQPWYHVKFYDAATIKLPAVMTVPGCLLSPLSRNR